MAAANERPAGAHPSDPGARATAIAALESAYGPPSNAGFGSAVFHQPVDHPGGLERAALARYQAFTGELWERYGPSAWLGPWRKVAEPSAAPGADFVEALSSIDTPCAASSIDLLLNQTDNAEAGRKAITAVFGDPAMADTGVWCLGDGQAMSGALIAGRYGDGLAVFLLIIMD